MAAVKDITSKISPKMMITGITTVAIVAVLLFTYLYF